MTDDARIGLDCFGGEEGLCAEPAHQGVQKCMAALVLCCDIDSNDIPSPVDGTTGLRNGVCAATTGPRVIDPGDRAERCNGVDDDCNGNVDDSPIDVGAVCGTSEGLCETGTEVCVAGAVECEGDVLPQPEVCDGFEDENCDGSVDEGCP